MTDNGDRGLPTPRLILDDGQTHPGVWINFRDPAAMDVVAAESFDWVFIDGQHGWAETSDMQALIEAAHQRSVPSIVRVAGHGVGELTRVLDAGARAVVFPTVEDAETAATLVASTRYAPRGKRSWGHTRRPRYEVPVPGNPEDDALCILMVESAKGLDNLDGILAQRPDGIFVGPWDLAISLGRAVEDLFAEGADGILGDIASRCLAAGVVPGLYTGDHSLSEKMATLGFRFMPIASDTGLLAAAARNAVAEAKHVAELALSR